MNIWRHLGTDFPNLRGRLPQCAGVAAVLLFLIQPVRGAIVPFAQVSDPPGIIVQTNYINTPAVVSTMTAPVTSGSYRFTHWTISGVRYNDDTGRSLNPPPSFTLYEATVAIAHYLPATQDSDADGIPDWYEIEYYGDLSQDANSDTDGDGFTLAMEYSLGFHPRIKDELVAGGLAQARSAIVPVNFSLLPTYRLVSNPPGFLAVTNTVDAGTVITAPDLWGQNVSGYLFAYWDLDGVRQQDIYGTALGGFTFTVTSNTVATAHYYPANQDSDADGVPDWFEYVYYGSLGQGGSSDTDGDEFTLAQEFAMGTVPTLRDEFVDGGLAQVRSANVPINFSSLPNYRLVSSPAGFMAVTNTVNPGTIVTTPDLWGQSVSGYRFAYWDLDGVRQQDIYGMALGAFTFTVTNNTVATAHYYAAGLDSDFDGVPDWFEYVYYGSLGQSGSSDTDGDGFTLAQEFAMGTVPTLKDEFVPGGISRSRTPMVMANLQGFPLVTEILVNGANRSFFSTAATSNSGQDFGANTAPALGDWNGDGTVDLFVGASNGVLRVFENTGSPVVPNLVEQTTNFAAWAWAWSGITNPAPALGDWNGDGKADLAIGGDTGTIVLLASPGSFQSLPTPTVTNTITLSSTKAIPALADVTGDGRAELFVLLDDGTVNLCTNSDNALLPFSISAMRTNLLGMAVPDATGLAVADTQGTGAASVLVSDNTGRIWEFQPAGAGGYALKSKVFGGTYDGFAQRLTIAVADFDGDGDMDIIGGFAGGGLVYLKNPAMHLVISPPSVTVVAGQPADFDALNTTRQVNWTLLRNSSGGGIDAVSGAYQSGPVGGSMDVIEAVDASGMRGRAYANVIGTNEIASFGKAIIVGGGRDLNDPVWLATDYIANKAYNVLRYKGYARANIQYLSFDPGRDIDGNGLADDIAGFSSFSNVSMTFTNWVGNANRLFVYLVDHGSTSPDDGYFRLNTGENLTATQLNAWLTAIQNQYQTEVVVVLDFCYAGRFLQDLAYAGPAKRVVIAATAPNELTYFLSGGFVSFSDLFLSGLLEGLDLEQAFLLAQSGMLAYQDPTMDDNGDGVYQANVDGTNAARIQIGATHLAGKDVPVVGEVAPSQTLSAGTTAALWADQIQSYYPIQSVYCTILSPGFLANTNTGVPVTGVSEVELTLDPNGRYQASFDGFTEAGAYKVNYYARDIWGSVSSPQQGLVIQAGFDERMILVAGGSTNDPQWAATANMAATACQTALARRLDKAHIQYLSAAASQDLDGDGTNDVAGVSSLANLSQAITNWAAGANKLTVYLLGSTTNWVFRLNGTESLSATQLDGWLDRFQTTNRSVIVVMDFDGSGSYVPGLAATNGQERIVLASTKAGATSLRAAGGLVSFSEFLLSGIFDGQSLGAAFNAARDVIRTASGSLHQTAALDDNGNGIANEKNVDGILAAQRYLGAAFVTGEDSPFIGEVMPPDSAVSGSPVLLWADEILDVSGISNVWCVITPPDYDGQGDLPQTNLTWNADTSRYEVSYTNFTQPGTYVCTFFAVDVNGVISAPRQTQVMTADAYEPDDSPIQATIFQLGDTEPHNFHTAMDEDWVKFYAPTGLIFNIEAQQLGTNSDVRLDLYYEPPDGTLALVDWVDDYGTGADVTESLTLDLKTGLSGWSEGVYYVRVSSADTNRFGPGSEYELRIYVPVGGAGGVILLSNPGGLLPMGSFNVYLGPAQALATGAGWRVQQLTNQNYFSNNSVVYSLPASPNYTLSFRNIPGFLAPTNRSLVVKADQTTSVMAYYLYTNVSPRAASPVLGAGGVLQLTYLGYAGKRYAIEESTNLLKWAPLVTNPVPPDGLLHFNKTNSSPKTRAFYRARLVP
jgi:hypothetical protein